MYTDLLVRVNLADSLLVSAMSFRFLQFGFVLLTVGSVCAQSTSFNPYADRAAQLKEASGNISFLKDNNPWALNVGDFVQVRQTITTGPDGYGKFQVSDGSTFEVFPNSRILFRVNPSSPKDLLDLYLGKVKVHIEKLMGGRPNNNTVNTSTAIISVRGTTFAVEAADDTTQVSVEEGVVDVIHNIFHTSKTLYGGDSITVYKNQDLAKAQIDKGGLAQKVMNAMARLAVEYSRMPRGTSGGGSPTGGGPTAGNGGGLPTDTGTKTPTPPAPPPPPPPAPPPPGP